MVDQLAAGLVGGLDGVPVLQTHMTVGYTQTDIKHVFPAEAEASPGLSSILKCVAKPVTLPLFPHTVYMKTLIHLPHLSPRTPSLLPFFSLFLHLLLLLQRL